MQDATGPGLHKFKNTASKGHGGTWPCKLQITITAAHDEFIWTFCRVTSSF